MCDRVSATLLFNHLRSVTLSDCADRRRHFNASVSASLSVGLRSISIAKQPTMRNDDIRRHGGISFLILTPRQRMYFELQMYSMCGDLQERFLTYNKVAICIFK